MTCPTTRDTVLSARKAQLSIILEGLGMTAQRGR